MQAVVPDKLFLIEVRHVPPGVAQRRHDTQGPIGRRNVSSRMRHFLQEFSVEPPRFLEAVC